MRKKQIEFNTGESHINVNDILLFPENKRVLVVDVAQDGLSIVVTCYPFKQSKYWIVTALRFIGIKLKYWFIKLWKEKFA